MSSRCAACTAAAKIRRPRRAPASSAAPAAPQRPAISQIATGVRLSAKEREARNRADEEWNLRVPVKAGQRDVVVTFVNRTAALDESPRLPFLRPYPSGVNIPETRLGAHLRSVEIEGPLAGAPASAPPAGTPPAREQLFACRPPAVAEAACASRILTSLATRGYRRPAQPADLEPLLAFYREGREGGSVRARHRARPAAPARQPGVPVSRRARSGGRGARLAVPP